MPGLLCAGRMAVVVQCMTVYPVLLYIIRSQVFSAFIYRRAYPGPLPVLLLTLVLASITSFLTLEVNISDVLRFAGAFGCLICVYGVPSLVHRKESKLNGSFTLPSFVCVGALVVFGLFCVVMQLIPPTKAKDSGESSSGESSS
uniref:Amino acid transporter transmembrane domain-containing protein n=1 Tax=Haptolina ericina TaxID=156174 RepID=A0A7S3FFW4_9EUKA